MKTLLSICVVSLLTAGSAIAAPAQPLNLTEPTVTEATRTAGGPIKAGERCWTVTDNSRGFGYFDRCDTTYPTARSRSQVDENFHGGGGDGGGGGGR